MPTGGRQRDTKEARERARVYQARLAFHAGRSRRRTRDNLIAGIGGGLLILAVIGGQTAYFVAGPGAPAPSSTPSPTSATPSPSVPSSTPAPTPASSDSPATTPSPTTTP